MIFWFELTCSFATLTKPAKAEVAEKEPKGAKKRGRKPSVKVVEKVEPKKRGRKKNVPTLEVTLPVEPLKKAEKAAPKVKVVVETPPVAPIVPIAPTEQS